MAIIIYKLLLLSFCSNLNLMLGNHKITSRVAFTCLILCEVVKKCKLFLRLVQWKQQKSIFLYIMYIIKFTPYRYLAQNNHKIEKFGWYYILAISNRQQ